MYIVIMGGGRVGLYLSKLLIKNEHDVTIIELDEEVCEDLSEELDALIINGNGTDSSVLEDGNIEDADYYIAVSGNDESNLLSSILVKKYGVPKIIARVSNTDNKDAFKEVGIDNIISPELATAVYLESLITKNNTEDE